MRFTPKTDREIAEERVWPEGEYSFEVTQAAEYTSKAGNDMIKVMMKVFKPDGTLTLLTDYLFESMPHKLKHFFDTTGMEDLYNSGEIQADSAGIYNDLTGATGMVKLRIQKSDDYPDRNQVKDYVKQDISKSAVAVKKTTLKQQNTQMQKPFDDIESDEIPF